MVYARINRSRINRSNIKKRIPKDTGIQPRFRYVDKFVYVKFNSLNVINKIKMQTKLNNLTLAPLSKNTFFLDNKVLTKHIETQLFVKTNNKKKKRMKNALSYIELLEALETVE
jgi:hypothetical protein